MRPTPFIRRALLVLPLFAALGSAVACLPQWQPAVAAAGVLHLSLDSPSLSRAVDVQVWYPAVAKALERPVLYTSTYWGFAAPDVAAAQGTKHPLVLLAHGWRGTRFDLSWIAEALARKGYVVASLDAPDADAKTFQNAQAPKIWFRAAVLKQLIDAVGEDSRLKNIIDINTIAVIGHSAGGSTAMVLAGAQIDPERFAKNFPESAPVVAGVWSDPRIRAIVGLNPGTGPVFTPEGLSHVHVPTLIISGTGDHVAPEASNAQLYAQSVAHAEWLRVAYADHYTFMPVCSPWGRLRGFSTCTESYPQVDRQAVHMQALSTIEAFLSRSLAPQGPHA